MKRLIFISILCHFFLVSTAQPWLENLPSVKSKSSSSYTFYDYQKAFNAYWEPYEVDNKGYYMKNGVKSKAPGWKQFHRWEWDMEGRINPATGEFPTQSTQQVYNAYIKANPKAKGLKAASWSSVGPNSSEGGYAGIGRINCIAFHPSDNNTYWIGAPAGGLWVTTDNGVSWNCLTDDNNVLGISDIVIPSDFATSNTIYIATGDRDGWDNRSVGVLKSTNGGSSWSSTGISFTLADNEMVSRLLLDPSDNNTIIAATTNGVYKTIDAGATWTNQLTAVYFIDMEYKPGDYNTLYGSTKSGDIYFSTDGGSVWTQTLNETAGRVELAVTPVNSAVVYAIAANSGLYAIYKSTNSGASFTEKVNGSTINLLGWKSDGSDLGKGQGSYDLSIAVSPTDENTILVGGVNTWRSTDGGTNWAIINHWWGDGVPAVHADKHMLKYRNNGGLFECNDGGVYLSEDNGSTWSDKSNGLLISQMYKLGISQTVAGEVITGLQDNGSKLLSSGVWHDVKGGDGMECLIDYTDANVQYATYVYGQIDRTLDHWSTRTNIEPSSGAWVTPYIIDPIDNNTIYAGYSNVWKTTNKGDAWTEISSMNSAGKLRSMAIAQSNNSVLYVADLSTIWKTSNGGSSWNNITGSLPVVSSSITYIAVKHDDENTIWVTLSGYNSDNVYESIDGGVNWTDISTGLPELPAYSIVQNKQSNGEIQLYVGTELGVYFKEGVDNWIAFNIGLPNVKIGEIEIYYDADTTGSKLIAATYGRGLWETAVEQPSNDLPYVITTAPSDIIKISATVGGNLVNTGSSAITEKGVVWNTTENPTISNTKIVEGTITTGIYSVPMTGLSVATTYYIRAYATNASGTAYGANSSFTTDCNTPLTQATNVAVTAVNDASATTTWTSGGEHVLLVAKEGSAVDVHPTSGVTYINNSDFNLGEDLGSGNIAVYSGINETATMTGLNPATEYHFAVYKYNDVENCYNLTSPAVGETLTTGYCLAGSVNAIIYMSGITFADSVLTSGTGSNRYEDYTDISVDIRQGSTYMLTVTTGNPYPQNDLSVWIDYNDNDSFDDAGEQIICTTDDGANGDYEIFIPVDHANLGSHRMRIRTKWSGSNCGEPCGNSTYGEVEDYTVNVLTSALPLLTTVAPGDIALNSATAGGNVTYEGSGAVTARGVVWSTSLNPTLANSVAIDAGAGLGIYSSSITGLATATTYYVRAYATNASGTRYGDEYTFTTLCNPPESQATDFEVSTSSDSTLTITWESEEDYVLVLAKEGSAVNVDPFRGETYATNSDFTLGEDLGSGNIAVYGGTDEMLTITNLNIGTYYYFAIFTYSDAEKCYNETSPATGNVLTTGYCFSYANAKWDSKIDEVIFNTINVNSAGDCETYTDNTSISTDVEQEQTYSLSITVGTCNGSYDKAIKAFIDWNGNESFDDAGELVYTSAVNDSTTTYTTDVTVPEIYEGSVRMRIVCVEDSDSSLISSCGTYKWGETEDYTINICEEIEIEEQPIALTNVNTGDNKSLSVVAISTGTNMTYQWRKDGVNVTGANEAIYQIQSVSNDDVGTYSVVVKGDCGELISDDAELSVATSVEELVNFGVNIFPNPTSEKISINFENGYFEEVYYSICDINGNLIKQGKIKTNDQVLDISSFNSGVYLIKVNDKKGNLISTNKIIKN